MKKRARRMLWLVAALSLAAGFSLSLLWDPDDPLSIRARPQETDDGPGSTAAGQTELIFRYEWPDGRVGRIARQPLPDDLGGLSQADLQARHPDWRIESVSPQQVVVTLPCQRGSEGFVGVSGGYVAVYDGSPEGCSTLREMTDIPLQELPAFQVSDVRRGIPFQEEGELQLILEGLRAP